MSSYPYYEIPDWRWCVSCKKNQYNTLTDYNHTNMCQECEKKKDEQGTTSTST